MHSESEILERLDALSDPARLDLHDELALDSPLTEIQLRSRVPSARAALPYHLSRLSAAGLASKDSDTGAWSIQRNPIELDDAVKNLPAVRTATQIAMQVIAERRADRSRSWSTNSQSKQWAAWADFFVDRDYIVASMRPEDVGEFGERLHALVTEFRDRDIPDGEPVIIAAIALPLRGCR